MVFRGAHAWRNHPVVTYQTHKLLVGLGPATALFAGYLALDRIFGKHDDHGHGHGHGHGHEDDHYYGRGHGVHYVRVLGMPPKLHGEDEE